MNAFEAFGLVAGVASIAGVVLALRYARRAAQKEKRLCYSATRSRGPLVSARALRDYNISVLYKPRDADEQRIPSAFVNYLLLANLGREPILGTDIAPANPLRVSISGAQTLDLSLEAVTRSVANVHVGPLEPAADRSTTAKLTFDFLDYLDGARLRVLTTGPPEDLRLLGDIVGMPGGVQRTDGDRRPRWIRWAGTASSWLFVLTAVAITPFVYRRVTGSWDSVWLLALPIVALVVPLLVITLISTTIWPAPRPPYPEALMGHGYMRRLLHSQSPARFLALEQMYLDEALRGEDAAEPSAELDSDEAPTVDTTAT